MAKTLAITEQCPMELGLNILGGRWTLRILWQLSKEPVRFRELQRRLRPITTKTLTQQLRTLESQGMVERRVYPASPPQVEYRLSPVGQTILPSAPGAVRLGQVLSRRSTTKRKSSSPGIKGELLFVG